MSLFTLFQYKHHRPQIAAVMNELTAMAHFQPEAIRYESRSRWHLHAASTTTAFYSPDDQVDVGDGITALTGYVLDATSESLPVLDARALSARVHEHGGRDLAGDYALAHLSSDGVLNAFSDPHRGQSLYYVETPELFAVSSRPSNLAFLAGITTYDPLALAAVSALGYGIAEHTPFRAVRAVPQGATLTYADGRSRVRGGSPVIRAWETRGLDADPGWTEEQIHTGARQAARIIELATSNGEIRLGITGGKDSRLTLAMCLASGLGPSLRLFTKGTPDHPDVVVGRMIAEASQLPHEIVLPAPQSDVSTDLDPDQYLERISTNSFQCDGLVGAWDTFRTHETDRRVQLNGLMGEVLKAFAKRDYDPERTVDARTVVALQSPFDPMNVLRQNSLADLSGVIESRFTELRGLGYGNADIPDLFYYENRVPNWLGVSRQVHSFTSTGLSPLGVVPLALLAMRATASERKRETLHFRMMKDFAPQLLDIPFAMQSWHSSLAPNGPPPIPLPAGPGLHAHGSWQYSVNTREDVRSALVGELRRASADRLWATVDRGRVLARLESGPLAMKEIISLLGIASLAFFESSAVAPVKMRTPSSALPLIDHPAGRHHARASRE